MNLRVLPRSAFRAVWIDFGIARPFAETLALQRALRQEVLAKRRLRGEAIVYLLSGSHAPTYTFGRRCRLGEGLKVLPEVILAQGAALESCERGGMATYHGPGQIMLYPVFHLPSFSLTVKGYADLLERAVCDLLAECGIEAKGSTGRGPGVAGVWVSGAKIASCGIHVSAGVCIQGVCLNWEGDLKGFEAVLPCGDDKICMTQVSQCRGAGLPTLAQAAEQLVHLFLDHLQNATNQASLSVSVS